MDSTRTAGVVIVEGTCGSGKTTLIRSACAALFDRDVRVIAQRATYAPIADREDDGTLDDESNRRLLYEIVGGIRGEHGRAGCGSGLVLVDTLHATHFVRAGALTLASFVEIDREVDELGALVVVLRISERSIRERTIVGRRGTGFYEYARKFGATEDERVAYFVREQERLVDLLQTHSRLRRVVLDGDQPVEVLTARLCSLASASIG